LFGFTFYLICLRDHLKLYMLGIDFSLNENCQPSAGNLLIAEPLLEDKNFSRSVVLLCQISKAGAFGLVLNNPTTVSLSEVLDVAPEDIPLYLGGPVEFNTLHYIHQLAEISGSIELQPGLYWGGDFEQIQAALANGKLTATNARFFLGYSGWGDRQLHEEIEQDTWIISTVRLADFFEEKDELLWKKVLEKMGGKYKMFAKYPINARLN